MKDLLKYLDVLKECNETVSNLKDNVPTNNTIIISLKEYQNSSILISQQKEIII